MKCPKCGFENRPGARFCKQCGQPLEAPTPSPPPGEVQCPSCGAPNKPGARFCARCGAPLTAPAPAPPTPPPAAPPPAYAPPYPTPTVPATPSPYVPPPPGPEIPPIPPVEAAPARRPPRWLWIALPIALVLCLAAMVGLGYRAYRQGKLPFLRPSPTPTATPTATVTPTPETAAETPSPAPSAAIAQIALTPSATDLKVGETLTLTVTITNTGDQSWTQMEYRLLGQWEPVLKMDQAPGLSSEELGAGQSRPVTFTLTAQQEGDATLKVLLLIQTGGDRPRRDMAISEEVNVHVGPGQ